MCDCIVTVNQDLRGFNAQLVTPLVGPQRMMVQVLKLDEKKRGKTPLLFASHCPFCGVKYPSEGGSDLKTGKAP